MNDKELAELDLAVARAEGWRKATVPCAFDVGDGWTHSTIWIPPGESMPSESDRFPCMSVKWEAHPPRFSGAVEAMRLLEKYRLDLYANRDGTWDCCKDELEIWALPLKSPTPAIAICRAVVALGQERK